VWFFLTDKEGQAIWTRVRCETNESGAISQEITHEGRKNLHGTPNLSSEGRSGTGLDTLVVKEKAENTV